MAAILGLIISKGPRTKPAQGVPPSRSTSDLKALGPREETLSCSFERVAGIAEPRKQRDDPHLKDVQIMVKWFQLLICRMQKNRFAGAAFDDSDDEPVVVQKQTKTQKKKEERKIADKPVKFNANKMAEGGFEVVNKDSKDSKPATAKGRGERKPAEHKPRGGARVAYKNDAEGVQHKDRKERQPFRGKAREEGHPYDRRDGTGRGRRPDKKDGHGKGNWGDKPEVAYKKKTDDEEKKEEPVKEEKKEEPKVQVIEEVLGYDLDEVLAQKTMLGKKQGRDAEGIKGQKVEALTGEKLKQSTLTASTYGAGVATNEGNKALFGFAAAPEEEDDRRGKRGAPRQAAPQKGGRRQNAKQALKKTEEDFPSL